MKSLVRFVRSNQLPIAIFIAFFAGTAAGLLLLSFQVTTSAIPPLTLDDVQQLVSSEQGGVRLTNPLLDCADLSTAISEGGVTKLHDEADAYITSQVSDTDLIDAAFYYRDLNNGPWTVVNGSNLYSGASLLKVPLAMSFYRRAESNPSLLTKKTTYVPDPSVTAEVQPFTPTENVVAGHSYTPVDLIRIMLEQSSNEAAVALANLESQSQITSVYSDLGLPPPTFGADYEINVRSYASFLRILYNATYLNRADSESVLSMLTKASYTQGIVAGVPSSLLIAHKFGTRRLDDGSVYLNDCGIIYNGANPYVLCIMTHGGDFNTLSSVIQHLSSLTYRYVMANG